MRFLAVLAVLTLAACGADGEPEPHNGANAAQEPRIGVVGSV